MKGPIGIEIKADSKRAVSRLNELMRSLQDRTEANQELGEALHQFVEINFMTEGAFTEAGAWAELADSTIAWKDRRGYSLILQNTMALRESFAPFHSADVAGVGAKPIHAPDKRPPDMAKYHQFGTDRIPARPMLPTRDQAAQIAMRIYGKYVKDRMQKA